MNDSSANHCPICKRPLPSQYEAASIACGEATCNEYGATCYGSPACEEVARQAAHDETVARMRVSASGTIEVESRVPSIERSDNIKDGQLPTSLLLSASDQSNDTCVVVVVGIYAAVAAFAVRTDLVAHEILVGAVKLPPDHPPVVTDPSPELLERARLDAELTLAVCCLGRWPIAHGTPVVLRLYERGNNCEAWALEYRESLEKDPQRRAYTPSDAGIKFFGGIYFDELFRVMRMEKK